MKLWKKSMAAALVALLFVSTTALTAVEAGAALKEVRRVAVQEGTLRGVVVDSEGRGLVKAVVDVRDSKREVLSLGVTKADGSFCISAVPDGEYQMSVNGEFTYSLLVAKDAEARSVALVVPTRPTYSAGANGDGDNTPVIIGGVLFGGAGLALMLLSNTGGDCQ